MGTRAPAPDGGDDYDRNDSKKMQPDWIGTNNFVQFQEVLNRATDDGKFRILSQLLANEFAEFKKPQAQARRAG
jgi:hypothetical protein